MSSCAASRVIYFLLFHNPFHNHNVHTSATSLLAPPIVSSPGHLPPAPHLHTPAHTCTLLDRYCAATFHRLTPNPRDDLRPRPRRPRKRPRHRRHGIHRSLPICRCQRQANGGVV
ncbi:hypothetical protein AYX14_03627 [Cryptococcus neoformans]|nr:hypothetical protein AYX14_03627 [Cryptococcus neoformans var. grubii]